MNRLSGRYRVGEAVYSDNVVTVHRGHDQLLNRPVTLELLQPHAQDPAVAAALIEKGRRMALSELPNVVALYDQDDEQGQPYLVWEELQGRPLSEAAPLGAEDVAVVVRAVGATLRAASKAGIARPHLDAQTVRFDHDRTQIANWGLPSAHIPAPADDAAALATVLALAATGSPDGRGGRAAPAPIMRVVERAVGGQFGSAQALEDELQAATTNAGDPTVVVPRGRPTVILQQQPGNRYTPQQPALRAAPPAVQPPAPAVQPNRTPRWLLPVGVGLLLFGLIAGVSLLRGERLGAGTSAAPAPTEAASNAATEQPAPAEPAEQGTPFVVSAIGNQRLLVRDGPGRNNAIVGRLTNGTVVRVVEGPQPADGYNWVRIEADGVSGWCIREGLKPQ